MAEIQMWLKHLSQPEYIHVLLNPIPLYGTAAGLLGLILGFIIRSRPARRVAIAIIGFSCLMVWPVVQYGHKGEDRVKAMSNADAQAWLETHEERAEDLQPLFYATAALCLVCLLTPAKFPRTNNLLALAVLVMAMASLLAGGWIGHSGGQIRHSEFRDGPPPPDGDSEEHEGGHEE